MVAQRVYNESIREQTRRDFFKWGVTPDYEAIHTSAWAAALLCPVCHRHVHPENVEKHNGVHHPRIKPMPGLTIMVCDIEPQTISPERITRCAEEIKYPLMLRGCTAIVLYEAA